MADLNYQACLLIMAATILMTINALYAPQLIDALLLKIKRHWDMDWQRLKTRLMIIMGIVYIALAVLPPLCGFPTVSWLAILLCLLFSLPFAIKVINSLNSDDKNSRRYLWNCATKYGFLIMLIAGLHLLFLNPNSEFCIAKIISL